MDLADEEGRELFVAFIPFFYSIFSDLCPLGFDLRKFIIDNESNFYVRIGQ